MRILAPQPEWTVGTAGHPCCGQQGPLGVMERLIVLTVASLAYLLEITARLKQVKIRTVCLKGY